MASGTTFRRDSEMPESPLMHKDFQVLINELIGMRLFGALEPCDFGPQKQFEELPSVSVGYRGALANAF